MKRTVVTLLALVSLAGCSNLERSREMSNPVTPAKTLALQVCSNCHGVTGVSVSPNFPNLAGQQPDYIVAQLTSFRGHSRSDPAGFEYMWGLSRGLTDEQIKGLAEYFSQQAPKPGPAGDAKIMAMGKEIFEKGVPEKEAPPCTACHGAKGEGLATFPRLAYQHADYLHKQLRVFRDTQGRPGTPMEQVSHGLSNQQVEAVAAYLQAFPDSQ